MSEVFIMLGSYKQLTIRTKGVRHAYMIQANAMYSQDMKYVRVHKVKLICIGVKHGNKANEHNQVT